MRRDRRLAARGMAILYGAAGALGVVNAVVVGPGQYDATSLEIISAAGLLVPLGLLTARRAIPAAALQVLLLLGSIGISAGIHFTGGVPNAGAMLYLWVAIYAFYFFSTRSAVAHVVIIAGLYATVAALNPPPTSAVGNWTTTVVTVAVAGACVGMLSRRLDQTMGTLGDLAETDVLTGIANRRGWSRRVALEQARASRAGHPLTVALIDLDGFKAYNDGNGHDAGDRLLTACATAWSRALREVDFIARFGGDEFAVLLPDCSPELAERILSRLRESTPAPARCTIGLAGWSPAESVEAALRRADQQLYERKPGGTRRTARTHAA